MDKFDQFIQDLENNGIDYADLCHLFIRYKYNELIDGNLQKDLYKYVSGEFSDKAKKLSELTKVLTIDESYDQDSGDCIYVVKYDKYDVYLKFIAIHDSLEGISVVKLISRVFPKKVEIIVYE